jgi:phosphatidate cytidylyltransferase
MGEDAPKSLTRGQKILRRTLVGGSIALVTAGLLYLVRGESGPLIVHGFAGLLLAGSTFEASRMAQDARRAAWSLGSAAVVSWALVCVHLKEYWGESASPELPISAFVQVICASLLAATLTSAIALAATRSQPFVRGLRADIGRALWFVPALSGLALLHLEFGSAGLVSLIVLSKVGDVLGYFGGSLFGKHHPLPKLSPGKTTEGFACSLLGGIGVGIALAHWGVLPGEEVSLASGALLGGVMNVAAQVGDLIESWVKRRAGVKDSGKLFGPTGGFLDLLDSFFVTVPVALWIGLTGAA